MDSNLVIKNQPVLSKIFNNIRKTNNNVQAYMLVGEDEEKIEEARVAAMDVKSLDYSFDDENAEFYNSVASFDRETDAGVLDLKTEIAKLPSEEKKLIVARYFEDMTQSEASRELGISQVQVSRKEGKILEKLRVAL